MHHPPLHAVVLFGNVHKHQMVTNRIFVSRIC